jgi:hypothetical protein
MTGPQGAIFTATADASARSHNLSTDTDPDVTLKLRRPTTHCGFARFVGPHKGGGSATGPAA